MKNHLLLFTSACILLASVATGCKTTKPPPQQPKPKQPQQHAPEIYKPVSGRSSKQPKFIQGVYMDHHNKTTTTANAMQPRRQLQRTERVAPVEYSGGELLVSTEPKAAYRVKEMKMPLVTDKDAGADNADGNYVTGRRNPLCRKYADALEAKPKDIDNIPLYSFIDKWIGTEYRLGGCDASGIDCSGFAQKLYADVYGVDLLRTSVEQFKNCVRVKHSRDAVEGDLVFFRTNGHRISHVGVYLMNDYFIHSSTSSGVMISNLNEEYWQKSYAGIGRLPKDQ